MKTTPSKCALVSLLFCAALTACGDGGGGASTTIVDDSPGGIRTPTAPSDNLAAVSAQRTLVACTLKSAGGTCDFIVSDLSTSAGPAVVMKKILNPGYQPGQRVCLKAGNYPYARLWIENVSGSADNPVEFINCGGQVVIGNNRDANGDGYVDSSRGMEFYNARFVKVSGAGSPDHHYGIKLAGTLKDTQGLSFSALSTDMEVEFLEVAHSGFAGIMAKTDATCTDTDPYSFRGISFVQRNSVFHDNYIHDVAGEGFYVGYSFFYGNPNVSGCVGTRVYSHPVEGTRIYNNRLERTGCEAIQIGIGANSEVHSNYIRGYGVSPFAANQNNGIQIGAGSSGRFYNNYIINPDPSIQVAHGIIMMGYKDTLIHGNTIVNPSDGIYIHETVTKGLSGSYEPYTLTVANNTVYNPVGTASRNRDGRGIWSFNPFVQTRLLNNLLVLGDPLTGISAAAHVLRNSIYDETQSEANRAQGKQGANFQVAANTKASKGEGSAHFTNVATEDFRLTPTSPALDSGADVTPYNLTVAMGLDHPNQVVRSLPRLLGSRIDVGAFEAEPPQQLARLMLVNAQTDQELGAMTDGMTIRLDELGTGLLSVRADTLPATVGSVSFALDGVVLRTESGRPYCIAGDGVLAGGGTDYLPWAPSDGAHTLVVTPYSGAAGSGTPGRPTTLRFSVQR